jgi:hypothetical protein
MRKQMTTYIEQNGMLNRLQSGFRSNHITTTALLKITNDLLMASEERLVSLLGLLDFSKAFDSVDRLLLCSKLSRQYNISTSAVTLIVSYLRGWRHCVLIVVQASDILPVTSGVVHAGFSFGSIALLFVHQWYHKRHRIKPLSYVCWRRPTLHQLSSVCVRKLKLDLDRIQGWSQRNGLFINASKSQIMVANPRQFQLDNSSQIFLSGNCIELHQKVKNLGLMMNCNLTWDDQRP